MKISTKYLSRAPHAFLGLVLSSALLSLAPSAHSAPLVSIGDNADLYFNGSSSLRWASNIFRNEANDVKDVTLTLSPGFELDIGRGASNADFTVFTRYDIVRYNDLTRLDTELLSFGGDGAYSTSRFDWTGSFAFKENKTNSGQNNRVNDLIEFNTINAATAGEYRFSPKFSLKAGVNYRETEYQTFTTLFRDRNTISFPVDLYYKTTPKLDLSAGYTYSETEVDSSFDQTSNFFNVGARGEILPKLVGFFKVGYRTRETDNPALDDSGMLGLDANFTWTATPKTTFQVNTRRDFAASGEGDSTENTSVNVVGTYAFNTNFSANTILGYSIRDYSDRNRQDDMMNAGARLNYTPNQYWQFSTGYTYVENDSNDPGSSYENHMIDFSVSLRY